MCNNICIMYIFFYLIKVIQLVKLITINKIIVFEHNLVLIFRDQMSAILNQRYFNNVLSIKVTEILDSENVHLFKLNHPINFMNLPTVLLVIKLNKYSIYVTSLPLRINYFGFTTVTVSKNFPISFPYYNFFLLLCY